MSTKGPASETILVLTNTGSPENAIAIAEGLVEARLAACVNILPGIRSIYRWQDRIENDPEHLLLIKTRRALFSQVRDRIVELHTYELPEVISVSLDDGEPAYLDWVLKATS